MKKKYTIKKASNLFTYLKKMKIKSEQCTENDGNIIIHLEPNGNGDELFWFGVDYGMYANNV